MKANKHPVRFFGILRSDYFLSYSFFQQYKPCNCRFKYQLYMNTISPHIYSRYCWTNFYRKFFKNLTENLIITIINHHIKNGNKRGIVRQPGT